MGEVWRPVDPKRMMPVEEVLGGVYVPCLLMPNVGGGRRWDLDHGRFQANDPRLAGEDKRPQRYSYAQWLPRATHEIKNDRYDAVLISETPHAIFQSTLLGALHYFPRWAVDLSGNKPQLTYMTDSMCDEVHREGWVTVQPGTGWKIGYYLARYALANGLDAIRDSEEVMRFAEARNEQARKFASFGVVRRALEVVLDPFEPTYEVARRKGAIRRPEPTAARFVSLYFNRHQPDYISTIADTLLTT